MDWFLCYRYLCHERVNDLECISFLGEKIWNLLPYDLKSINNLEILKNQLMNRKLRAAHVGCAKYIYKILVLGREMKLGLFH